MGRPFHPAFTDLGIAPSPHLVRRVSFLFRSQPSPVTLLSVMHPAVREELPQEVPVAHAPARVESSSVPSYFSLCYSAKYSRKNSLSRSRTSSSEFAWLYSSRGSALSVRKVGPHLYIERNLLASSFSPRM